MCIYTYKRSRQKRARQAFRVQHALRKQGVLIGAPLYPSILPMQQVHESVSHVASVYVCMRTKPLYGAPLYPSILPMCLCRLWRICQLNPCMC